MSNFFFVFFFLYVCGWSFDHQGKKQRKGIVCPILVTLPICSLAPNQGQMEPQRLTGPNTHTAPAVFQGRFPSLCCAPRLIPVFTQFDCFVLLVLSRKHLVYCFATTPLIKRRESSIPAGYWVTIRSTAMLLILRSNVIAQIEPRLRTQTLMKRGFCNSTSGRLKSVRGLAALWAHLWCPAPVLPPNSVLCHFGFKPQQR